MARNKYPEVTVEKILNVSQKLFFEKGYEATTIQDIVDELGGLTKGAIYHHFKSKEDIMNALSDKMFFDNNPFHTIKNRTDLNGLQKMRAVVYANQEDTARMEMGIQSIPILKNPRILAEMMETNRRVITPLWLELLEEGNRDGSIHTEYAKEIAELIPLLNEVWMASSVYPTDIDGIRHKLSFLRDMLEKMGVPLIDDEMFRIFQSRLETFPLSPAP